MLDNVKTREQDFFSEHKHYLLHFLERTPTAFNQWLIKQILTSWDRQIGLLDAKLVTGKVVVEACCGNPRMIALFRRMGARLAVGYDLTYEFMATGIGKPVAYAYREVLDGRAIEEHLAIGDIESMAIRTASVDTLCCFQSLHHVSLPAFVSECARVLKPSGAVFISDPVGSHPLRKIGDWVGRTWGPLSPDEQSRPPQEVIEVFTASGFEVVFWRAVNPFSEIYFHLTELITPLSRSFSFYLKLPLLAINWLERRTEGLLARHPRYGWRFVVQFRKK